MLDFLKYFFNVTYTPRSTVKSVSTEICQNCTVDILDQTSWGFNEGFQPSYHSHKKNNRDLNADIIRNFFDNLAKEYSEIAIVDSGYIPNGVLARSFLNNTLNNTKTFRARLKAAEIIFCPLHQNNHWFLIIIEKYGENTYSIKSLDGFNRFHRHLKFYNEAKALLEIVHDNKTLTFIDEEYYSYPIPKQNNANDCGVVICHYANKFLQGKALEDYEQDSEKSWDYSPLRSAYGFPLKKKLQKMQVTTKHEVIIIDNDPDIFIIEPPQDNQRERGSSRRPILV